MSCEICILDHLIGGSESDDSCQIGCDKSLC